MNTPGRRAAIALTLLGCGREPAAPRAARLFDDLRLADLHGRARPLDPLARLATAAPALAMLEDGPPRGTLQVTLPVPAAGPVDVVTPEGGTALDQAVVEALHLPGQLRINAEEMTHSGEIEARDRSTFASRLSIAPGASLRHVLPPLPAGGRLQVVARAEAHLAVVAVELAGQPLAEHTLTEKWQSGAARLPASLAPSELVIRCVRDGAAVIKRVEIDVGPHDTLLLRGPPDRLHDLRTALTDRALLLSYLPAEPPREQRLERAGALGSLPHDPAGVGLRFAVLRRGGSALLVGPGPLPPDLRVTYQDRDVPLGRAAAARLQIALPEAEPGLHELVVQAASAAALEGLAVIQPQAGVARRRAQDPLREPLFPGCEPPLQRLELGQERRPALLLPQPSRCEFVVPPRAPSRLRFAAGTWREGGRGAPPAAAIQVRFQRGTPDRRELLSEQTFSLPDADRWFDFAAAIPPGCRRIEFASAGAGFGVDADGKPYEDYLALAEPVCVDPAQRPGGIVLYLVDTLRADHLSLLGHDHHRDTTPCLKARGDEFLIFTRAYAPSSWTRPSTASLLTGLHPTFHGAYEQNVLASAVTTLAEALHAAGHATGAVVTNPNVSGRTLGFDEGFDTFRAAYVPGDDQDSQFKTPAEAFQPWIEQWLDAHAEQPFFLYVHSLDPHSPYTPPEEEWRRYDRDYQGAVNGERTGPGSFLGLSNPADEDVAHVVALYDAEVRQNDRALGRLMDFLEGRGLWERCTFVLTSDHGEEFQERGRWEHGERLFEEQIHVPLVWKAPAGSGPVPRLVHHRVQLMDVAPSLLELAGLPAPRSWSGVSFAAVLRGQAEEEPGRRIYCEEPPGLKAVLDGPRKLILDPGAPAPLYFDLQQDPDEKVPSGAPPADLVVLLEGFPALLVRPDRPPADPHGRLAELSQEEVDQLMALGYLK